MFSTALKFIRIIPLLSFVAELTNNVWPIKVYRRNVVKKKEKIVFIYIFKNNAVYVKRQ